MTLQEVCQKFNYSQSYVKKNFKKVQERVYKKYRIMLNKIGRGDSAYYQIVEDKSRAPTLYTQDSARRVMISQQSMSEIVINMDFATFLGIIMTPFQVFRGSYDDFLRYIQMDVNKKHREDLKQSLRFLAERDYINYVIDKTDQNYFFAGIYKKIEEEMRVGIEMIQTCKRLQVKYNKKSWVPLLKLWAGIKYLYVQDLQPYTNQDLCKLTGLNMYQVRASAKILEDDNAFITDKAYAGYMRCLGKKATLNILHEGNLQ